MITDYSAELGVPMSWEALFLARSQVAQACARAGRPALDVPYLAYRDEAGLAEEAARVKALGFAGKLAIHPAQIAAINGVFLPGEEEVSEARAALEAFAAAAGGAVGFKGRMLDAPVVRHYRRLLAMADLNSNDI